MDQDKVVFRVCVKPPRKLVLVQKLLAYLRELNIPSGIDLAKKNFPDKQWLIFAIATVSQGRDEIFHRDYMPVRGGVDDGLSIRYVPSEDPLFQNIPLHLQAKGRGRHLAIGGMSKEDKLDLQIKKQDARLLKQKEKREKM